MTAAERSSTTTAEVLSITAAGFPSTRNSHPGSLQSQQNESDSPLVIHPTQRPDDSSYARGVF